MLRHNVNDFKTLDKLLDGELLNEEINQTQDMYTSKYYIESILLSIRDKKILHICKDICENVMLIKTTKHFNKKLSNFEEITDNEYHLYEELKSLVSESCKKSQDITSIFNIVKPNLTKFSKLFNKDVLEMFWIYDIYSVEMPIIFEIYKRTNINGSDSWDYNNKILTKIIEKYCGSINDCIKYLYKN